MHNLQFWCKKNNFALNKFTISEDNFSDSSSWSFVIIIFFLLWVTYSYHLLCFLYRKCITSSFQTILDWWFLFRTTNAWSQRVNETTVLHSDYLQLIFQMWEEREISKKPLNCIWEKKKESLKFFRLENIFCQLILDAKAKVFTS